MKAIEHWFDNEYYHILYQHRDYKEAQGFISKLINNFNINKNLLFFDSACGKGRFALALNQQGIKVEGIDASKKSIAYLNKKCAKMKDINFYLHDIRVLFKKNYFDFAINMFTSIGYFDDMQEYAKVIDALSQSLKKGGKLLIDYLNQDYTLKNIIKKQSIHKNDIVFNIKRFNSGKYLYKEINIKDKGKTIVFVEKIRLFKLEELITLLKKANIRFLSSYGDYQFNTYHTGKSPRMIVYGEKK